jgi:CRP/FNR family cyclic AMP-dependent transcriptional regulator
MSYASPFDKAALLSRSPLFSDLTPEEVGGLLKYAVTKRVAAGGIAFHKGGPGNEMFALISGGVKIVTLSDEGKEVVLAILAPGDVFGELSMIDGRARTATVVAVENSALLVLERSQVIPFLERHPKVAIKMLEGICKRLRMTDELLEDVVFLDLPSRLAKRLLSLAEHYGKNTGQGRRIELKLSQAEIGNMVGTSRESVNKQLRMWGDEGVISMERGHITVLQPNKLKHFAP